MGFFLFLVFIRDLDRIQTCNLLSRNQMRYSVAPRGLFCGCKYKHKCGIYKPKTKKIWDILIAQRAFGHIIAIGDKGQLPFFGFGNIELPFGETRQQQLIEFGEEFEHIEQFLQK